jgi:hypothetical protein
LKEAKMLSEIEILNITNEIGNDALREAMRNNDAEMREIIGGHTKKISDAWVGLKSIWYLLDRLGPIGYPREWAWYREFGSVSEAIVEKINRVIKWKDSEILQLRGEIVEIESILNEPDREGCFIGADLDGDKIERIKKFIEQNRARCADDA